MVTPAQSSQSIQPCMPPATSRNDANFSRIAAIAIPIITALISFLVLSAQAAMVITAVVTIVSVAYSMRTEKQPPQQSPIIEPNLKAADPSRPQEIMFMSAKRNDTLDINKAEYMTVIFKTKKIAEQFIKDHGAKLFASGGYGHSLEKPTHVKIYSQKNCMQKSVDTLKEIYRHEGSVSSLCPISFAHYEK